MTDEEIHNLLVRADSLCSLIYHRERSALTTQTQRDLKQLCTDLREATQ